MPRIAIDFSRFVVYKLCCKDVSVKDEYVGGTTCKTKRKNDHKSICLNPKNKKHNIYVYQFIREHGGWENWDMIEVEAFPCKTSEQARTRERYWLETLGATLNLIRPIQTDEEHREQKAAFSRADAIQNRKRATAYRIAHPEQVRQYFVANAKQIRERLAERITCDCGMDYRRGNKAQHLRSAKHIAAMALMVQAPE